MSDIAIRVENLSKRYRIGLAEERHDTFVAATLASLKSPLRNFRRLRNLSTFADTNHDSPSTVQTSQLSDTIWALKDVSFEVKQGEVVGVIGRNGAGKSTLLKILSRITHPSSGRIELNGRVSSLLEVGTGFHPELTGRENIYLNGTILGMRKREIDQKFDEIVDFSGVEKFIDTPVKRYSSGMGVRLAFSVAAHLEPEILLVDEVLAVGDAEFQRKCLGKMGEVANEGRTILFVSHNMGAISRLCEQAIWIDSGTIELFQDSPSVISSYLKKGSHVAQGVWSRPNRDSSEYDGPVHLDSVQVCQPAGVPTSALEIDKPFEIEVAIGVIAEEPIEANVRIKITSEDGTIVLQSADLLAEDYQLRTSGKWASTCRMPAYALNRGGYMLSVYCDQPHIRWFFREEYILSWNVEATSSKMSRLNTHGWVGIVGPGLPQWHLVKQSLG